MPRLPTLGSCWRQALRQPSMLAGIIGANDRWVVRAGPLTAKIPTVSVCSAWRLSQGLSTRTEREQTT